MAKNEITNKELEMIKNRDGYHIAEVMFKITKLCETDEDILRAMLLCAEIILKLDFRRETFLPEVIHLLRQDGILCAFEVSVNENEENKMVLLTDQIKAKFDACGRITYALIRFYRTTNCIIYMKELKPIHEFVNKIDIAYDFVIDERCTDPILRASVLVMHEPNAPNQIKNN